jgi:hypothetical protein
MTREDNDKPPVFGTITLHKLLVEADDIAGAFILHWVKSSGGKVVIHKSAMDALEETELGDCTVTFDEVSGTVTLELLGHDA